MGDCYDYLRAAMGRSQEQGYVWREDVVHPSGHHDHEEAHSHDSGHRPCTGQYMSQLHAQVDSDDEDHGHDHPGFPAGITGIHPTQQFEAGKLGMWLFLGNGNPAVRRFVLCVRRVAIKSP